MHHYIVTSGSADAAMSKIYEAPITVCLGESPADIADKYMQLTKKSGDDLHLLEVSGNVSTGDLAQGLFAVTRDTVYPEQLTYLGTLTHINYAPVSSQDAYPGAVECGVILENDSYSPIYCNVETGECFFPDPIQGEGQERLISELSVGSPVEVSANHLYEEVQRGAYGLCIGVIFDGDNTIVLQNDSQAAVLADGVLTDVTTISIYDDYEG